MKKPANYWNKENCTIVALNCKTRTEFQDNYGSAYDSARRNKWLDEICGHMIIVGDIMKRCIYAAEFDDNFVYVGLTFNYEKRISDHMRDKRSQVFKHSKLLNKFPKFKQLTNYLIINIAKKEENYFVNDYKLNNWNILNISETGAVGGGYQFWTKEKCKIEANKYTIKVNFLLHSKRAYQAAHRHGWLDEICEHMDRIIYVRTEEDCRIEALKYNGRKEFAKKSCATYTTAIRNGWLDEVCSHMTKYKRRIISC
jgi:hypothetical protein